MMIGEAGALQKGRKARHFHHSFTFGVHDDDSYGLLDFARLLMFLQQS